VFIWYFYSVYNSGSSRPFLEFKLLTLCNSIRF